MEYAIVSSPGESRTFLRTLLILEIGIGLSYSLGQLMASCKCCRLVGWCCCNVLTSSSCNCSEDDRATDSESSLLLSKSGFECVGGCCQCSNTFFFNYLPDCYTVKLSVICCEPFLPCLISYIVARFVVVYTCFPYFKLAWFMVWIASSLFVSSFFRVRLRHHFAILTSLL